MPHFSVRLDDDLASRFDAAAADRGGRSALLRHLIEAATEGRGGVALPPKTRASPGAKLTLRLSMVDLAALEDEAARVGLSRTQWTVSVIRRRLHERPQLTPASAQAFIAVQRELRRIGVNINQIARAVNVAVLPGAVLDLQIADVERLAQDVGAHLLGLRAAFEGDLRYWSGEA